MRLLALAATGLLASACTAFSTQSTVNSVTRTTFDDRFHDGLAEVWNTCSEPLDLEPGDTSISLLNGCDLTDTVTAEGDAVVILLAADDPIALSEPIPTEVFSEQTVISGFPWPMQNCEVTFDVTADFNRLRLLNQETKWRTHDGEPSLWIDYDFPASANVVDVLVTADVECPSAFNETTLQASIDLILPNDPVLVSLTGLDLDIDVELDHIPSTLTAELDLEIGIGGIEVNTFIFDLANLLTVTDEELMAEFGLTLANMEAEIEPILRESLAELPDVVVEGLMAAVPSTHVICDVQIVNTDDLRIKSDVPGPMQCLEIAPVPL